MNGVLIIKTKRSEYYLYRDGKIFSSRTQRFLVPRYTKRGYTRYNIGDKDYYIHRLVAETFIPNPNNYNIVNHIDSNTFNNCVENLEWCTQQQNLNHSYTKNNQTPIKNKRKCILISPDGSEKEFEYCTQVQNYIKENARSKVETHTEEDETLKSLNRILNSVACEETNAEINKIIKNL
jgi:hypothetical protein